MVEVARFWACPLENVQDYCWRVERSYVWRTKVLVWWHQICLVITYSVTPHRGRGSAIGRQDNVHLACEYWKSESLGCRPKHLAIQSKLLMRYEQTSETGVDGSLALDLYRWIIRAIWLMARCSRQLVGLDIGERTTWLPKTVAFYNKLRR